MANMSKKDTYINDIDGRDDGTEPSGHGSAAHAAETASDKHHAAHAAKATPIEHRTSRAAETASAYLKKAGDFLGLHKKLPPSLQPLRCAP